MSNVASETVETEQKIGAQTRRNAAAAAAAAGAASAAAAAAAAVVVVVGCSVYFQFLICFEFCIAIGVHRRWPDSVV